VSNKQLLIVDKVFDRVELKDDKILKDLHERKGRESRRNKSRTAGTMRNSGRKIRL
jgi:hypothetical protein